MKFTAENISLVTNFLTMISIAFLVIQVSILRKQYKGDHERSRRESVIKLQELWMEYHNMKTRYARQILPFMDEDSCRDFWLDNSFKITLKSRSVLCDLFNCKENDLKYKDDSIVIEGAHLYMLRDIITKYLNLLEIIFTAWRNNIGDRKMIEEEFGKNISLNNSEFILEKIVNASAFLPSIKAYTRYLKETTKYKTKKKIQ